MVLQNNKIKILITASTFPRWDNDSVPYFVLEQVKALQSIASDAELHILAPHHEGAKLLENWDGITIHRFRYFWPEKLQKLAYPAILPNVRHNKFLAFQIPFLLLFEFIAIFRLCKKISPNLLYSHWFVPQGVVGGLVALIFKIPHVYTSHSSDIQIMNRLPILGPFLVRFFSGKSKACTVVSKRSLNKLKDFYNEKQWDDFKAKVKIIPMGVDTNLVKNLELRDIDHFKQELGLTGEKIILFIGRLSEKKGIYYLIEAFTKMTIEHSNVRLLIAGDGELYGEISDQIQQHSLESKINLLGYVTGDKKLDCLTAADIVIIPSIITDDGDAEGLPVSLLEGLAAGKICIATDVSGADDILTDKKDGLLINQKSPEDINRALNMVLNFSAEEIADMKNAANTLARDYDWSSIAEKHMKHFSLNVE